MVKTITLSYSKAKDVSALLQIQDLQRGARSSSTTGRTP